MGSIPQSNKKSRFHPVPGSDWFALKTVIYGTPNEPYNEIWEENDDIRLVRKYGGVFVNDTFLKLWDNDQGLMFLDGGYGSSKTTFAITRLLIWCMENKYFKCFYGRQKKTEARELHDNIIREIKRNGWEKEFDFSEKPNGSPDILHIKSGNMFKLFGCDDVDSLKGIDNPSHIFIDEINQISFAAFGMLWTRLRTPGVRCLLIGCFNNCDVFPDHWLAKYIYGDDNPKDDAEAVLLDALKKSNIVRHHSIYTDNKVQNPHAYLQKLIIKANGDPDKIEAYCQGKWGVKLNAQPYYKMFNDKRDVKEFKIEGFARYNPNLALHIGFDENVNPYLPCLITQAWEGRLYIIDEIAAENPNNRLSYVCDQILQRYKHLHKAAVYIYGDATSKKDDVKMEKGKNTYTEILRYLNDMKPELRVPDANPNNSIRGKFINSIFALNYGDIHIIVHPICKTMIEDLRNCEEDPDGNGKNKKRVTVNGVQGVQKYGHFGDILDYITCELFQYQYSLFQSPGETYMISSGGRTVKNSIRSYEQKKEIEDYIEKELQDFEDYVNQYGYKSRGRNGY